MREKERERERERISADSVLISELKDRDLAGAVRLRLKWIKTSCRSLLLSLISLSKRPCRSRSSPLESFLIVFSFSKMTQPTFLGDVSKNSRNFASPSENSENSRIREKRSRSRRVDFAPLFPEKNRMDFHAAISSSSVFPRHRFFLSAHAPNASERFGDGTPPFLTKH